MTHTARPATPMPAVADAAGIAIAMEDLAAEEAIATHLDELAAEHDRRKAGR